MFIMQEERRRQEELERSLRRPGEDLLVCGGAVSSRFMSLWNRIRKSTDMAVCCFRGTDPRFCQHLVFR